MNMMPTLAATAEQIRQLDRIAIEQYGIPGILLMENAGRACAAAAREMLDGVEGKRVAVLCGRGNNGGDGFVAARHLTNWGANVFVPLLARLQQALDQAGDAVVNLRIALNMGIAVREANSQQDAAVFDACAECDLIVDALLGTGVKGEVREPFRSAIAAINRSGRPVLAVDVPSGLDCDTGEPLGVAVRAQRTVTFAVNKTGFTRPGAHRFTGDVEVAEISIPRSVIQQQLEQAQSEGS